MLWSFGRALAGGVLIGAAAALALLAHGRIAGISGIVGRAFDAEDSPAARAFRLPFVAGLVVVGALTALVAPHAIGAAPPGLARLAIAGLLVGVGTTVANGCTSGHGVCGIGRGSPRSLVAVISFMAAGMVVVALTGAT
jgi:uncharacterized membrane protein YedE/YeeE